MNNTKKMEQEELEEVESRLHWLTYLYNKPDRPKFQDCTECGGPVFTSKYGGYCCRACENNAFRTWVEETDEDYKDYDSQVEYEKAMTENK